jgi:hypothetical protein
VDIQGRKNEPYTESPNSPIPKRARQVISEDKSMIITFYDIKGTVHKEFVLADHTVNSPYYCDIYGGSVKICKDSASNFGDKRTGCYITTGNF